MRIRGFCFARIFGPRAVAEIAQEFKSESYCNFSRRFRRFRRFRPSRQMRRSGFLLISGAKARGAETAKRAPEKKRHDLGFPFPFRALRIARARFRGGFRMVAEARRGGGGRPRRNRRRARRRASRRVRDAPARPREIRMPPPVRRRAVRRGGRGSRRGRAGGRSGTGRPVRSRARRRLVFFRRRAARGLPAGGVVSGPVAARGAPAGRFPRARRAVGEGEGAPR